MLQKVTRLDSVPTAEETVLTTEVPTKESRLYTLLVLCGICIGSTMRHRVQHLYVSDTNKSRYHDVQN